MDTTYSVSRKDRNYKWPIIIGLILLLLAGLGYLVFSGSQKFISPLPETPAVEIIFYTPTPEPVTPTSTPSATPKAAKKPTATPTKSATATPTAKP